MTEFWCQTLSNWASPGSSSGAFGRWEESGIFGTWIPFQHIHSLSLSLPLPLCFSLPRSPWWSRKIKKHAWPCRWLNRAGTLLSNSPQPCVNPQGDRENSKHVSPAKTKKHTTVRPLSAVCLLCKGPGWLSITPQHAGVAKQPLCIMKRNTRAKRQNSQRVKMLRVGPKDHGLGLGSQYLGVLDK